MTNGQVDYEIDHLLKKIKQRAPNEIKRLNSAIEVNPIFEIMEGGIADWEKLA